MQIYDFDKIDDWSPWLTEAISGLSLDIVAELQEIDYEYIQDARDHLVHLAGRDRLLSVLHKSMARCHIRFHHGTRLAERQIQEIKREGLKPLILRERAATVKSVLAKHQGWAEVENRFDQTIADFGVGNLAGRREDGCIHACFSAAGLLGGCSHYLAYGAEVDGHIARSLFGADLDLGVLSRDRCAAIVSFHVTFEEGLNAANPYGTPDTDLPVVFDLFVGAWAYKLSHPEFTVASQIDCTAARFSRPILATDIDEVRAVIDDEIDFLRA